MRTLMLSLLVTFALVACGKSDSAKDEKGGDKAAKAAGPKTVTLAKLANLKIDVPDGAEVGDGVGGGGVMIQGPDLVVAIEVATDAMPATLAAAKENASAYGPKNVKEETLPDGFALTFENTGSMGKNYFLNVRRTVDGKAYWCTTTASQPAQQANALKACKSLRK